ncbi:MAG: hypothetical protein R3346_03335 [Candidatus Spechtbacterales bacterium]|nr:hypothetical protein [Candidatus Spechtbacterales bacterium]
MEQDSEKNSSNNVPIYKRLEQRDLVLIGFAVVLFFGIILSLPRFYHQIEGMNPFKKETRVSSMGGEVGIAKTVITDVNTIKNYSEFEDSSVSDIKRNPDNSYSFEVRDMDEETGKILVYDVNATVEGSNVNILSSEVRPVHKILDLGESEVLYSGDAIKVFTRALEDNYYELVLDKDGEEIILDKAQRLSFVSDFYYEVQAVSADDRYVLYGFFDRNNSIRVLYDTFREKKIMESWPWTSDFAEFTRSEYAKKDYLTLCSRGMDPYAEVYDASSGKMIFSSYGHLAAFAKKPIANSPGNASITVGECVLDNKMESLILSDIGVDPHYDCCTSYVYRFNTRDILEIEGAITRGKKYTGSAEEKEWESFLSDETGLVFAYPAEWGEVYEENQLLKCQDQISAQNAEVSGSSYIYTFRTNEGETTENTPHLVLSSKDFKIQKGGPIHCFANDSLSVMDFNEVHESEYFENTERRRVFVDADSCIGPVEKKYINASAIVSTRSPVYTNVSVYNLDVADIPDDEVTSYCSGDKVISKEGLDYNNKLKGFMQSIVVAK